MTAVILFGVAAWAWAQFMPKADAAEMTYTNFDAVYSKWENEVSPDVFTNQKVGDYLLSKGETLHVEEPKLPVWEIAVELGEVNVRPAREKKRAILIPSVDKRLFWDNPNPAPAHEKTELQGPSLGWQGPRMEYTYRATTHLVTRKPLPNQRVRR